MKHIRMDKNTADKWLAALRSGEYKQTRGKLEAKGRYCCLGVLQQVISGHTQGGTREGCPDLPNMGWLKEHGITFLLEKGSEYMNPYVEDIGTTLADINDSGTNFTTIADLIEGELQYTDNKKER